MSREKTKNHPYSMEVVAMSQIHAVFEAIVNGKTDIVVVDSRPKRNKISKLPQQ